MLSPAALGLDSDMLDEAKAYLRVETDEDDAPLAAIMLAAIGHAEAFVRMILIRRVMREVQSVSSQWQALSAVPVQAIIAVTGIPAEGARFALAADAYTVDIDGNGTAQLRVTRPGIAGRIEVEYTAGLAATWPELPESLRLGILRLVGHLYAHRDAGDDGGPPDAVTALLRPWRRMLLS